MFIEELLMCLDTLIIKILSKLQNQILNIRRMDISTLIHFLLNYLFST